MNKPHIQIIVGTTRPNRVGLNVAKWFKDIADSRNDMTFELLDLADINLPLFDEPHSPSMNNYEHDHTKQWSKVIARADGYVFVTGEYNHSIPASLKNAIDYLYHEWNHKAVSFVSYGGMGGVRAVEHLIGVANELKMVSVRERVQIIEVWSALDENGVPKTEYIKGDPSTLLDELSWWTAATMHARGADQESSKFFAESISKRLVAKER